MSKSKNGIFENLTFVISKTEEPHITTVIHDNGGKVLKALTNKTDYFVQGYNIEDDGRLEVAGDKCIRVIAPEYILDCVDAGTLLDINLQALGKFENIDEHENIFPEYFNHPDILSCFRPISKYCRELEEQPQSYGEFLKTEKYVPSPDRYIIYLQPFRQVRKPIKRGKKRSASGDEAQTSEDEFNLILSKLKCFMSFFLCMPVKCLPECQVEIAKNEATFKTGTYDYKIATCNSQKGWVRLEAMEIIGCLEELRPRDGFCILGITDLDIFEGTDHDEPLLGRATGDQAGVLSTWVINENTFQTPQPYSLNPESSVSDQNKNQTSTKAKSSKPKSRRQASKKSVNSEAQHALESGKLSRAKLNSIRALFNTAAHETLHMFGFDHCVYYGCVMNSWSDPHLDPLTHPDKVSPLHLCPVDLRKLHHSLGFSVPTRYTNLANLFRQNGMKDEANLISEILSVAETITDM